MFELAFLMITLLFSKSSKRKISWEIILNLEQILLHNKFSLYYSMRSQAKTVDLSRISESDKKIPMSSYTQFEIEIQRVRYPVKAFSAAKDLQTKIQNFKSSKIKKELYYLLDGLNSYRQVRGDGNCFFRAIAFTHLADKSTTKFNQCFEFIDKISLTCCYPESIPKDFQKFYDHNFLKTMLEVHWESKFKNLLRQSGQLHMKSLLKLFNQNPFLDFIVILYYRAVCLKALTNFRKEVEDFLDSSQQTTIRKYSQESEGIILDLCSRMLKIEIIVFQVRKLEVSKYVYNNLSSSQGSVYLIFYENHYDIIEKNENIDAQMSVLGQEEEDYFADVSDKKINGSCFQCGISGLVYEDTGLCQKCYSASMNNLQSFKKDKLIRAKCSQCWLIKNDISESLRICNNCIENQKELEKKEKQKSKIRYKKHCPECKFHEYLIEQIGLCKGCADHQRRVYQNHISPKKSVIRQPSRGQKEPMKEENKGNQMKKSDIKQLGMKKSAIKERGDSRIKQEKKVEELKYQKHTNYKYLSTGKCIGCKYNMPLHEDTRLCCDCMKLNSFGETKYPQKQISNKEQDKNSYYYMRCKACGSSAITKPLKNGYCDFCIPTKQVKYHFCQLCKRSGNFYKLNSKGFCNQCN